MSMRRLLYVFLALVAIPIFGGCGTNLSSQEFGTVVEGIPQVQGADKRFEMPELGPPLPDDFRPKKGP
jgi:hypothetical protein